MCCMGVYERVCVCVNPRKPESETSAALTRVEIDGKLFQLISFDDGVNEFAAQRTFGLNGHR